VSPGSPEPTVPVITGVTGGSHGMTVACEQALALAADYDTAGDRMRDWAGHGGRVMSDADLLESAVLSPLSFAEAEAAVLAATSGPDGVLVASVVWEADAVTIRVAVRATQLTDELVARTWEALDHELGRLTGYALATTAPVLVLAGAGAYLLWSQLPAGTQAELADQTLGELQQWLDDHPEAVQHLANGGGGLLEGLWDGLTPLLPGGPLGVPLLVPDTESAAGLLAALYSDGEPVTVPTSMTVPDSDSPPADLAGLLHHLAQVGELAHHPDSGGTVEVQTIRSPDGSIRHVVYLPGTDDLATTPWSQDEDVRDLGTNLLLVSGQDNAYQQGVLDAMQQAGIGPGEPVALVGHSQGGMVAAAIASEGSPYSVTHVVTAGSPTAHLDGFPPGSHVLSLENHGDVVPLLVGEDNPDSAEQVTVRFDDGVASVVGDHELESYAQGAVAVQHSEDASIQEQLASLSQAGFVGSATGQEVTSQVFQISRVR
jgi:hypothetical protein